MLLTRSPLILRAEAPIAFDLHVLGTPPALILSQDQTLMLNSLSFHSPPCSARAGSQLVNAIAC